MAVNNNPSSGKATLKRLALVIPFVPTLAKTRQMPMKLFLHRLLLRADSFANFAAESTRICLWPSASFKDYAHHPRRTALAAKNSFCLPLAALMSGKNQAGA